MNEISIISEKLMKIKSFDFLFSISIRLIAICLIIFLEKYLVLLKNNTDSNIVSLKNDLYNAKRNLISFNNLIELGFKEKYNSTFCEYFCPTKNSICIEKNKLYDESEKIMISKILYSYNVEEIFKFDYNDNNNYSFSNLIESLSSLKKLNDEVVIKCACLPGYVTYFYSYNEIKGYCNYKQKLSIIASALEVVFGFGIGHIYAERTFFGLGKFFFSLFVWILLMFIEGILMHSNNDKLKILSKILLIFIRTWHFIDFLLFYFKIYYKDGNGVTLF